jgi:OmpA-OmpF porin, OOP family
MLVKKSTSAIVVSMVAFISSAFAQTQPQTIPQSTPQPTSQTRDAQDILGPYIGGAMGSVGIDARNNLKDDPSSSVKNGYGGKLFAGYQLTENFGAEVGGFRSGTVKRTYVINGANIEQSSKVNVFYLAGTARLPLGERFALNARLGVARGKISGTNVLPVNSTIIGSKTGAIVGFGGEYRFTPKIAGTVDIDYLPDVSRNTRGALLSAGVKVNF